MQCVKSKRILTSALKRTEADLKHTCKYFTVCPGVFAFDKITS